MARNLSQAEIDEREWQDSANWRFGFFYHSELDSRPWVPKRGIFGRSRIGGTPNFAQPAARTYFMLIVGVALFVLLIVLALDRSGILR
ncbi:MAG: hypothetical protein O7E56_05335 [SAR324 cluster bacterium]|nr:hypothetical protein [SAR324 cluster bacterium]MCZ6627638.1 hypothetical protein [SAR324 cluster bacterium]MCZ6645398.1 hypothetical protein [SAR324 cluster bacterium]MCZ6841793.1 hypothetical protein [SAR324 cluster bacterium]